MVKAKKQTDVRRELLERCAEETKTIDQVLLEQEEFRASLLEAGLDPEEVDAQLGHWQQPDTRQDNNSSPDKLSQHPEV